MVQRQAVTKKEALAYKSADRAPVLLTHRVNQSRGIPHVVHPRPEQRRLYTHLRPRLEWIGSAPESYRIIDGVVALIAALSLRDSEFLPPRS